MQKLIDAALFIDRFNDRVASVAKWSIAAACAISAANAFVRYGFSFSSNAFLEIQWYLFAACVMFGTAQVLRVNEHVRVDILYNLYPTRGKVWVDIMGLSLFLAKEMPIRTITQVRLVHVPGLRWLIVPRLVAKAGGLRTLSFPTADPQVLYAFRALAYGQQPDDPAQDGEG